MKKIAIVVAVLLFAAPAIAKVTAGVDVNVAFDVNEPNIAITMDGEAEITVTYEASAKPRAFALDLIVDSKGKVKKVKDAHTGESKKSVKKGFGIFPASFNRFIDADDPCWGEPNYTSVALPGDLPSDTQGGIDTNGVTIEMGSLYVGAPNAPNDSGTLFDIYVECWDDSQNQTGDCNLHIAANVGRGKVVLEDGNEPNNLNFLGGNPHRHIRIPFDWGDAPDPLYPTLMASNGARHVRVNKPTTFRMGPAIDAEGNGQPANLDDALGATPDDEDGVTNLNPTRPTGSVTVNASAAGGYLNAWMDFNIDGDWQDAGEQIFTDQALAAGNNALTFAVPAGATNEVATWSRWRFSTRKGLGTTGAAPNGEVEDHIVPDGVVCHVPDVVGDPNLDAQATIIAAGFTVNIVAECSDTVEAGIVISTDPAYCNEPGCGTQVDIYVSTGSCCTYPACWDWLGQCHGDCHGNDGDVDIDDFLLFKAAFATVYPGGNYNPCADNDRDGDVDIDDFLEFKANFAQTGLTGCPQGDLNGVYCP